MLENKNLEKGSLSIGVRSNVASFYLLDKIAVFHEKYNKIDIIITHFHSDHVGSLGSLVFYLRFKKYNIFD